MTLPAYFGFIPARYASTRFPGKPLVEILGKPMFWHVWARAKACAHMQEVMLCTDDTRIAESAASLGVPCIMTGAHHASGTDRVYEAACVANVPQDAVVVNIQGDEPALNPDMLAELIQPFTDPAVSVSTLAHPISAAEAISPDRVKVVMNTVGDALYFSRARIPFDRDGNESDTSYLLHVGLYAFRMEALAHFIALPPSPLEQREKLEQLRFLDNGVPIRVVPTCHQSHGVDRPSDIAAILPCIQATMPQL